MYMYGVFTVIYNFLCLYPGTNRGQADGFGLEILAKLKDVKNKVCNNVLS